MKKPKNTTQLFAVCVDNSGYPASLELFKIYRVLPDDDDAVDGDLRVIDESGEDYIYTADRFVLIDLPQVLIKRMRNKTVADETDWKKN